jgi:hypothetical protein
MSDAEHNHPQSQDVHADLRDAHGVIVQVETMPKTVQAVIVATSIIAIVFAIAGWVRAESLANEVDYLRNDNQYTRNKVERLVIELDNNNAILMRAGLKEPADMARGPAGNPNYPKRKEK